MPHRKTHPIPTTDLKAVVDSISNRELAVLIWLGLGIALILFSKKLCRCLFNVIRTLFVGKLFVINLLSIVYAATWVYLFHLLGLWEISLLKKTLFWFFGVAMVLVYKTSDADKPKYFRKMIRHLLEWALITEFIESFYSFPLWIELGLVPILFLLIGFSIFGNSDEKFRQIQGCSTKLIKYIAALVFFISLYVTITHWHEAFDEEHIKDLLLAPVMTVLFLPFLYLLALYFGYEILFLRLGFQTRNNKPLYHHTRRALIRTCKLNLVKLNLVKQEIFTCDIENPKELQQLLRTISTKREA